MIRKFAFASLQAYTTEAAEEWETATEATTDWKKDTDVTTDGATDSTSICVSENTTRCGVDNMKGWTEADKGKWLCDTNWNNCGSDFWTDPSYYCDTKVIDCNEWDCSC